MKFALLVLIVLQGFAFKSPIASPTPGPTATPAPTATATPTATPVPSRSPTPEHSPTIDPNMPKPFPTPIYDPQSFIRRPAGNTITVDTTKGDPATLIQAAEDSDVATVRIKGGGSIKVPVHLKRHTVFDSSVYSCDVQGYRCFLADNGVLVEGTYRPPAALVKFLRFPGLGTLQTLTPAQIAGTGTTIIEPGYCANGVPAIEVFGTWQDFVSVQHDKESRDITILGFHIKGRQKCGDGGVRQTISLSNCVNCAAVNNYLEDTGSIGIQFGGSSGLGFHARNFLAWRNITTGLPAAHFAVVNGENGIIAENYSFKFGKVGRGGGVSGFDLETNEPGDYASQIWVMNNVYDFTNSAFIAVGSAIVLQDPGETPGKNGDVFAVNNRAIGGTRESTTPWQVSCFVVALLNRVTITSNYCFHTAQSAIQWYGKEGMGGKGSLVQRNVFDSTGGGGSPTILLRDTEAINFVQNRMIKSDVKFGTDFGLVDCGGKNNLEEGNSLNGKEVRFTKCKKPGS